jgi:hypothetical protein
MPPRTGSLNPPVQAVRSANKARARKRWAIRSMVLLTLSAVCIIAIVYLRRDQTIKQVRLNQMADISKDLQKKVDKWGVLPFSLPELERGNYASRQIRSYALRAEEPVIIGYSRKISLFFQADGRTVLFYDDGQIRSEWMREPAFRDYLLNQEERREAFEEALHAEPPELP